jgi:DNA (cytosine-5)-methyltransferase 1
MPTFASLFTGGGLADIGALQAGYELLWGIEWDPAIAAVAESNLNHPVHAASVIGFDWGSLVRPDHLHMSPPCQDFSVAKRQGTVSNPNDEIADACLDALKVLQPNTVTLENVEGYRKAKGFQRIVDYLWGAGYWVNVDVLNSADFGVPQTRRRLILRAVKGGIPGPLPQPVQWRGWYQAIEDLIPELPDSSFAPWQMKRLENTQQAKPLLMVGGGQGSPVLDDSPSQTICNIARVGNIPKALLVHPTDQRAMPVIEAGDPSFTQTTNQGGNSVKALLVDGTGNSYGSTVTTTEQGSPSLTVKASSSKQASRASTPNGRVVRMTPRCLARFQTVPDWYVLPESKSLACKITGNGIPCLMMQTVMESFL